MIQEVQELLSQKGIECVNSSDVEMGLFRDFLGNEEIASYLRRCLTPEGYQASGIYMKPFKGIVDENMLGVAPGGYIRPFGYLVVGTSVGGNAICFDSNSSSVYWADHGSFREEEISYEDRRTGEWVYLPFSAENVLKALVPLSDSIGGFLSMLLLGELEEKLDDLD